MKLEQIELWSWQGLEQVCLDGLGDRINLVVGPNGAGKSRIFRAVHAAFFESHKGKARHKRQWQTRGSSTSPRVKVCFQLAGTSYVLEKCFLKDSGARLEGGGEVLVDHEAERRLRQLMKTDTSGSSQARPEDMGLWPLVWIPQHESHLSPSRHIHSAARHRLDDVLGAEAGEVAAGDLGDQLLQRVEAEHRLYWTPSHGNPTGDYGSALKALETARDTLSRFEALREQTREQADRLASSRKRLVALDGEIESIKHDARAAARQREEAESFAGELERLEGAVTVAKLGLDKAQGSLSRRASLDAELDEARKEQDSLKPGLDNSKERVALAQAQARTREAAVSEAEKNVAAARRAALRSERQKERAEVARSLEAAEELLEASEKDEKAQRKVAEKLAGIAVDDCSVAALGRAELKLSKARVALEVASARVRVQALRETTLDGEALGPGDIRELVVDEERTLRIGDVAELTVEPGGKELGKRRDAVADAERTFNEQLDRLGVASLEAAQELLKERRGLEKEQERLRTVIETRSPEGVEALREQVAELRGKLDSLGAHDLDAPELEQARAAQTCAEEALGAARADREAARDERENARNALTALLRDAAALDERVADLERKLEEQLDAATLEEGAQAARDSLAEAERQRDLVKDKSEGRDLEGIVATCERLERAVKKKDQERKQIKEEADQLRGALGNLDTRELHENLQDAQAVVAATQLEVDRLERRALAIRTLREALLSARRRTQEAVWSRVTTRVAPYLRRVLPGCLLRIEEGWEVAGVLCDQLAFDFIELSGGLREQLALIVRFALAEALSAEEPLPIVLDDPLVNTDPDRLATMIDIFGLAANNLQLLILSCDEADYSHLGEDRRYRLSKTGEVTTV